ncbi:hypothetical protein B0T22DRAFT_35335 [Podospora appendiculata]|uniref:Uncharacterized protein n=1 Tax=Podospora appendiculata TaxID=314037 RepID=A0AAE0XH90_9PEZI|nr:hypothetical protein B0T22DRAFT_35335 [Podospora appendiculata]
MLCISRENSQKPISHTTLTLTLSDQQPDAKKEKLQMRLAKSYVLSLKLDGLKDIVEKMKDGPARESVAADLRALETFKRSDPAKTNHTKASSRSNPSIQASPGQRDRVLSYRSRPGQIALRQRPSLQLFQKRRPVFLVLRHRGRAQPLCHAVRGRDTGKAAKAMFWTLHFAALGIKPAVLPICLSYLSLLLNSLPNPMLEQPSIPCLPSAG